MFLFYRSLGGPRVARLIDWDPSFRSSVTRRWFVLTSGRLFVLFSFVLLSPCLLICSLECFRIIDVWLFDRSVGVLRVARWIYVDSSLCSLATRRWFIFISGQFVSLTFRGVLF